MKILVVDDHPLIREALQQVLRGVDPQLELLEARTCDEALELARRHPDTSLILLDLALPGVDGFEALNQLRVEFPGIPVVILSASDQPELVTRALDAGAMGFISKTSSSQALVHALRLVLSGGVYLPPEMLRRQEAVAPSVSRPAAGTPQLRDPREIGLTDRQSQVLALLVHGLPNKLICRELNLAEGTVKIHMTAILKALGVTNRTQAVIAAGRMGLKLAEIGARPTASGGA